METSTIIQYITLAIYTIARKQMINEQKETKLKMNRTAQFKL